MKTFKLLLWFIVLAMFGFMWYMAPNGSSDSVSSSSSRTSVETATVTWTKIFPHVHLRFLEGPMNRASVDKTLAYLPAKEKVEYFVFFPDEPFELRSLVSSTSSWVKAEEIIKAYDGRAMLVRRMANGKVLYEGDLYPQP